nr:MAG TPA_asm: hypothetical protein [Caudoviricetes sp.]
MRRRGFGELRGRRTDLGYHVVYGTFLQCRKLFYNPPPVESVEN